ncbi:MAG: 4Fe-4S dicluster domain-containing protein [Lachnospiraceae bacterium]|nr:4Fe-4S dicluster domain-containing protein [Lachnospiraceae bacterium]
MVTIDQEKCIGCGLCVADCVASNIEIKEEQAHVKRECMQCGHCVAICPVGAASIPEYDMEDVEQRDGTGCGLKPEEVLRAIKFRRSIRDYKPERVKRQDLELLAQAARYTATAKNNQECLLVFVQEELEELKRQVWGLIDAMEKKEGRHVPRELLPYVAFHRHRKANPTDDFLFRNAPAVLFIASQWPLDAGLAAQNVETMAVSLGMGALYNGYLGRIADANEELKKWLGIEGRSIKACMLLGYPARQYARSAPRKPANVIWR